MSRTNQSSKLRKLFAVFILKYFGCFKMSDTIKEAVVKVEGVLRIAVD